MATRRLLLPDNSLYHILEDRVLDRITKGQFVRKRIDELPLVWAHEYQATHLDNYLVIGTNSITDMTTRTKYLHQWPYTAGDIAREYLTYCVEQSGEAMHKHRTVEHANAPVFFGGPCSGFFAYVDISACYYSIWKLLTLDACYVRGEVSLGNVPFLEREQFAQSKRIRNVTFGIMCKNKMTVFREAKYAETRSHTIFYRPDIVTYVLHTVQAIAQEAIKTFGVHMWLTDAAILPASEASGFQIWLAREWGLASRIVAEGSSSLLATGCYQVGEKMSKHYTRHVATKGTPCHSLTPKIDANSLKEIRRWLLSVSESHRKNWLGCELEQVPRPPLAQ